MVAEADGECLIAWFEDLVEKVFDVFLVLFDELLLAAAGVDDEADAQGELVVVGEETDLLRDAIFDDGEVVFGEASYDTAFGVVNAEGGVDEMGFHLDDRYALTMGRHRQKSDGKDQLRRSQHNSGTCRLR